MRLVIAIATLALCACGGEDDKSGDSIAKKVGSKVGATVTEFASGVGEGVDTKMVVTVEVAPAVTDLGLTYTVAKGQGLEAREKGFIVYFIAERPASGTFIAKALLESGEEIGRSKEAFAFEAEDAKYVTFTFPDEMDSALVHRYVIDLAG